MIYKAGTRFMSTSHYPALHWLTQEAYDALDFREKALMWAAYHADVLHVQEHPHGSNRGPEIDEYLRYTGTPLGNPWCAAAVSWCLHKAGWEKFKSAGVLQWWNGRDASGDRYTRNHTGFYEVKIPKRGDLFLNIKPGHTHEGFVLDVEGDEFKSLAGNTNSDGSREGYTWARKVLKLAPYKFLRLM
jgi:hypothetical protein